MASTTRTPSFVTSACEMPDATTAVSATAR